MCESRDVKGLYKKAREGTIQGFTGVTQRYEPPKNPDLIVKTETVSIRESTHTIIQLLETENVIPPIMHKTDVVTEIQFVRGKVITNLRVLAS